MEICSLGLGGLSTASMTKAPPQGGAVWLKKSQELTRDAEARFAPLLKMNLLTN